MTDDETVETERGPACYENWKVARAGRLFPGAYEVPLYTDAYVTGGLDEGYGPYRLINVGAARVGVAQGLSVARPAIVLRVEAQIVFDTDDELSQLRDLPRGTKCKRYHGGGLDDEVAALFSLSLGIRLKPGERSREFMPGGDPKGRPSPPARGEPALLSSGKNPMIRRAPRQRSLNDDSLVKRLVLLEPRDAWALVRAARLYQDAMWIAESQPGLSWLMFVSAVETAANHWRAAKDPPRVRLHASKPELERRLVEVGGEAHADEVATMIADSLGSGRKFADFVLHFPPDAPRERPRAWAQLAWDDAGLTRSLAMIYDYRSRALHEGTPFPLPMCEPPWKGDDMKVAVERPRGAAYPALAVQWDDEDLPMHLHTFEYIVQGALCRWWESMVDKGRDTAEGCAT